MEIENKVISKIRKMLAIANDDGATEGERDNAMRMAHAYMVKHNLSASELAEEKETRIKQTMEHKGGSPWKRTCMMGIAELFFCKYFYIGAKGTRPERSYFIGLESNTITVKAMIEYIINSVHKEGRRLTRENNESGEFRRSFFYGAASEIYRRCMEIKAQSLKKETCEKVIGTAIVLADFYITEKQNNDKFLSDLKIDLKTSKSRNTASDYYGYNAGKNYGKTVQLNTQIAQ